jgi:glycosyltransferase involved in cell wall biosynthesis
MAKKIIVIEDSSKSGFGGGQRVTLDFIDAISSCYPNIIVIDHTKMISTVFKEEVTKRSLPLYEIFGNGVIGKTGISSYSFGIKEIILFPIYFFLNITTLLNKNFRSDCSSVIYYTATKKAYLIACLLAKRQDKIIFHAHSLHRKGFFGSFFHYLLQSSRVTVVGVSDAVGYSYSLNRFIRIYNGISETNSYPKLNTHTPIVVAYIGSLISWKGVDYFLSAIDKLVGIDVVFNVYGSGNLEEALKKKWKNRKKIIFKGFTKEIGDALRSDIDILILPSISEEACPMVILEAFSHGVPVITTNIGGQFELIRNGGGISVKSRSSEDIARAITLIASYKYSKYSEQSLGRKAEFSIDLFKKNFLKVLNDLD